MVVGVRLWDSGRRFAGRLFGRIVFVDFDGSRRVVGSRVVG